MWTTVIVLIAIVGVFMVAGLIWFMEGKRGVPLQPVSSRRLNVAQSRLGATKTHAERLPVSLNRAKGHKSVIHEFVEASRIESHEAFFIGPSKEVATVYPEAALESYLDERLLDGRELVSMEPHWYHEQQHISGAMSITRPLAIVGWYLTWLRSEARPPITPTS
jgi:hypothetical protein